MPRFATLLRPLSYVFGKRPSKSKGPIEQLDSFPCPYCSRVLPSEAGRARHISLRESCRQLHELQKPRVRFSSWIDVFSEALDGLDTEDEGETEASITTRPAEAILHERSAAEAEAVHTTADQPRSSNADELISDRHAGEGITPGKSPDTLTFDKRERVFVERFPNLGAGAPINDKIVSIPNLEAYIEAAGNLGNPWRFDTAELLMTTGLTAEGREAHLQSHMYVGNTPWPNNDALMADIDLLPHGPSWRMYKINTVDGVPHKAYLLTRDIVEVVKDIMSNPAFKDYMHYAPERHYTTQDAKDRVYGNPYTANWWWRIQTLIADELATIIPLIIASDKTWLSVLSGGQQAYPVYITLGNIDKHIHRQTSSQATVLLAYLPVDGFENAKNAEEKAQLKNQLTHLAMEIVTKPLRKACEKGVEMVCADGRIRRGYPIVAGIVGDWPEHCMMSCVAEGGCPRCTQLGEGRGSYPLRAPPRSWVDTLRALDEYFKHRDLGELEKLGLKPWWPWWANLPYVNFHAAVMPDMLHQLHQGMIKHHAVGWVRRLVGKRQVDHCYMSMPSAEGMRHFKSGISKLTGQWTGRESREVAKQLLPVAASQPSAKLDPDLTGLTRTILDFTYLNHASRMTGTYIARIEESLKELHQFKDVLIREGVFEDDSRFDGISKLHMLSHYTKCIQEMGTPDNYSTEAPEHLHIECAKKPWRASNKVRPTKQMITFIQRYEALRIHRAYMDKWLGISRTRRRRSRVVYGEDVEGPRRWSQADNTGTATGDSAGENVVEAEEWGKQDEEEERRAQDEEAAKGPHIRLEKESRSASDAGHHVVYPHPHVSICQRPTAGLVKGSDIVQQYGAESFISALHLYLNKHKSWDNIPSFFLPTLHHRFPVWHQIYLHHQPLPFDPKNVWRDVIRARPETTFLEATFDVALLSYYPDKFGLNHKPVIPRTFPEYSAKIWCTGYHAGRVRAIFSLPKELHWLCPHPLVYVELFNPFSTLFTPFHCLNTTSHAFNSIGKRQVAVMSIHNVVAACHLAPQFRQLDPELSLRTRPDLLSESRHFFHNHYYNHFIFGLVEHWRAARAAAQAELRRHG